MVKLKFGKTFGLQENSAYKVVLKERKLQDKKTNSTGIRMKDVVIEAINHFGNPVSFINVLNIIPMSQASKDLKFIFKKNIYNGSG